MDLFSAMRLRRTHPQRTSPREATRRRAINRLETLEARHLLDGSPFVTAYEPTGTVHETVSNIRLTLSDPVLDAGARDAANYELLHLGADRLVGGGDDQAFRVLPQYVTGATEIGLSSAVDLSRWSEVDYSFPGGLFGEWRVDGDSVVQDINGAMSFFVSDFDLVNSRFEGRLQVVDAAGDDDIIGFVFGFRQHAETQLPDQYYLVSWKQTSQGGAEAGLKLAKITGTGGSLQRPDLWNLESSDPFIDVLAVGPSTGWQDGVAYDFAVDYASDGQIAITIRHADGGEVVWSREFDDPAPLGPGRVGFYNYSQANVRYQPLSSGDALPDGYYQLTVNAGANGLQGLDGSPLDGDGDGNGGDDFVGAFAIETGFPQVSMQLAPASDTGIAGDNLTRLRDVTYDVTVNKIGRVDIDFNGDQIPDESRFVPTPRTFQVTRRFDSDGLFFITATFTPASGSVTQALVGVTVDTLPPRLLPGEVEVAAAWSEYKLSFEKPVIGASLSGNVALFDTAGAPIELTIVEIDEYEYLLQFAPQVIAGNYRLIVGPNIADLAGNLMPESTERIITVDSDEFGPVVTGIAIQPNSIVVDYLDQGGVNPRWATAHDNYALLASGGDGVIGNVNDIDVSDRITQITFDPGTGRVVLMMDSPLADELYQLTINGDAPNGVQDLAGNLLEGGDYVADLPLNTAAATISLDLIPESDSNVATDNVTNDTTPTFEIAFNKSGLLALDFQNDGIIDERVLYPEAGVVRFTSPALADRSYLAVARFAPAVGGQVTAGLSYAIDTLPPQVAPDSAVVSSPWSRHTILFDGDVLSTFDAADVRLFGPQGEILGVAVSHVGGNTYELTFATQTAGGDYYFEIGPQISDVAGNVMPAAQRVNVTLVPDVAGPSVVAFTPLGARNTNVTVLELAFSEPVTDFDVDDVVILGPDGRVGLPDDALEQTGERTYRVHVPELAAEGTYAVTIGPEVRDLSGNGMIAAYQGRFSIDKTGPRVIGVSPSGTIDSPLTTIDVSFDQRIGNAPLDAFSLIGPTGVVQIKDYSFITDRDIRLNVDTTSANGEYTLTVGPGITDELGNPMAAPSVSHVTIALPDLQVGSFAELRRFGLPASANFGESLRPLWYGINSGDANTRGSWTVRVWLSRDDVLVKSGDNADIVLGDVAGSSGTLIPGQPYTNQLEVNLPLAEGLASGEYRLIIEEDAHNNLLEANEQNNYLASDPITITRPTLPDVLIEQVTATEFALPGGSTTVEYTLRSLGRDLLAGEGGFVDFYFSRDAATDTPDDDRLMAMVPFTGPLGADSAVRLAPLSIPTTGVSGPYFVLARLRTDVIESDSVNNVAISDTVVDVLGALTITVNEAQLREDAANPATRGLVTRNGDLAQSLVVTLVSSDPSELTVPSQVVIPAGQSAAAFEITVHPDATPDGNQLVTISASGPEIEVGQALVSVIDTTLERLALDIAAEGLEEGASTQFVIRRERTSTDDLVIRMNISELGQLLLPATIVIPHGALESLPVTVLAIDDDHVEMEHEITLTATAPGLRPVERPLVVEMSDVPQLSLVVSAERVSEGGPNPVTYVTVSRDRVTNQPQVVQIAVLPEGVLSAPLTVTIPAGGATTTFPVSTVQNVEPDGDRIVALQARPIADHRDVLEHGAASASLEVIDDDVPSLLLQVNDSAVAEGLLNATTLTLIRTGAADLELAVSLAVNNPGEIELPSTVTFRPGESLVEIDITTSNDGVTDGAQSVTVTASAEGLADGLVTFVVSDVNLPDLIVTEVASQSTVLTLSQFDVSYTTKSVGLANASGSWRELVFLSANPSAGDDELISEVVVNADLPSGIGVSRSVRTFAPAAPGQYWMIVITDATNSMVELNESNNVTVSIVPLNVVAEYEATVAADVDVALADTQIRLSGEAWIVGTSEPARFKIVSIHLQNRGFIREIAALTDFNGRFQASFVPLPGEAGRYSIGATHPGLSTFVVQDEFTLVGMRSSPDEVTVRLIEGQSPTIAEVKLSNPTDFALTNLQAFVQGRPGNINVDVTFGDDDATSTIPGDGHVPLRVRLQALDASVTRGDVQLRITSAEGAFLDVTVHVLVEPLRARLVAAPESLVGGMLIGGQSIVEFQVRNDGGKATGPIAIRLPEVEWLKSGSGAELPSLGPGESARLTLLLTLPTGSRLGEYYGTMALIADEMQLGVPFRFNGISELLGDLKVVVSDEYTYYAEGAPRVAEAQVKLTDPFTGEIVRSGVTDASGLIQWSEVSEGPYTLEVTAAKHTSYRSSVDLVGGVVTLADVLISRETVAVSWEVVPTESDDNYKLVLESTFETNVPIPVVTFDDNIIMPMVLEGETTQTEITIRNHGLIAAQNVTISVRHTEIYEVIPLITDVGVLPAKGSLTIPVLVRRRSDFVEGGGANGEPEECEDPEIVVKWCILCAGKLLCYDRSAQLPVLYFLRDLFNCIYGNIDNPAALPLPNLLKAPNRIIGLLCDCADLVGVKLPPDFKCKCMLLDALTIGFGSFVNPADILNCICSGPPSETEGSPGQSGPGGVIVVGVSEPSPGVSSPFPPCNPQDYIDAGYTEGPPAEDTGGGGSDGGVCARVKIRIEQEAVLARTTFAGSLEVANLDSNLSVESVGFDLLFTDATGASAAHFFTIASTTLQGIDALDGTGVILPSTTALAKFMIFALEAAAATGPTEYAIAGTLRYRENGEEIVVPLASVRIVVQPEPALNLKYFHQRDVFSDDPHTDPEIEPAIPYTLAVMVENNGAGVAKNLKITSAQPRIIENEKGLLIDFQIIATEVFSALGFSQLTPSLIANFGDIAPDEIKIARWLLTSTLQGQFIDYKATFEHIDGLGDPRLSLIKSVKIFEMIHQVYSQEDELPDFLTNEVPDAPEDLPDTIHLSDGTVHSVALAGEPTFDALKPSVADPVVEMTVDMAAGWGYLRAHDIGDGKWRLTRVVRSDGTELNPDNFWQTDRTFIEQGHPPRLENNVHLVDRDSTGRYTLYYTALDTSPPSVESLQQVSPNPRNEAVSSLDVLFTEDLASVDVTALRLTRDGGPNLIGPGVTITPVGQSEKLFRIAGLESLTSDDGEYRLTVDASLVRDEFGNAGFGAASAEWVNGSLAAAVESIAGPSGLLVNAPLDGVQVLFTRTIDFATLDASDLQLKRNGVDVPLTELNFSQTTERGYSIAGLADETSLDGDYQFCVNARTVADASGRAGVGGKCVSWTLDGTAPQLASIEEVAAERVPDGLGAIDVTFSEPIRAATFDWRDLVLTADGAPILLDASVSVTPLAANRYRIRGLAAFSSDAADYSLQVNAADVQDFAANAGVGGLSAEFDRLPPAPPAGITLSPATLIGADAWQAHSIALVLSGQLSEPGLTVSVFDVTTNQDLGVPTLSGMSFLLPIRLEVSGQHALRVRASDAAGNAAQTTIQVFVRIITVGDLNNVRNDFGTTGENLPADFDRNGVIDIQDLNFVRNNLGSADSTPSLATMPRRRVASNAWDEALLETQASSATPTTKHNAMDWALDVLASSFEDRVALDELQLERGSARLDAIDAALQSFDEVEPVNLRGRVLRGASRQSNSPLKAK